MLCRIIYGLADFESISVLFTGLNKSVAYFNFGRPVKCNIVCVQIFLVRQAVLVP